MMILGAQRSGAPLFDNASRAYDALLVLSFGGPEGMDDVMPFLENVTAAAIFPENGSKKSPSTTRISAASVRSTLRTGR